MKKTNVFKRIKAAVIGAALTATALVTPFAVEIPESYAATEINYAKALQYSLYLYDANMCGTEVGEKSQLDWRDDCHTYDSKVSTPYGTMDLSGGFHDCGDHVKFGITGAYSATMLGWSYYEYKDAFTKTSQAAHLQTITDYYCDYFKRCTVMNGSSVQAFCYQVGNGDTDHASWQAPEKDTFERPAYFATSSNPCTDVVAETAAALAMNYLNFGNSEDLTYAKALYSFAKTNNKSGHSEQSYYTGTTWLDDLALASIILYKATNDSSYKTDCGNWISQSNYQYTTNQPLCWDSVWPAVNIIYANEWDRVATNINNNKSNVNSEGYYCHDEWGSARYNAALQLEGLLYDKYNNSSSYTSWAKGQMEYIFGNNKNNQCYMVGYDSNSVTEPHHRAASGFTNFPSENRGKKFANVLVGALVGGPDKSGNYKDEVDEYRYTEVGVDYNAALVGALAGLYLKYGSGQSIDSSVPGVSQSSQQPVVTTKVTTVPAVTTTTVVTSSSKTTTAKQTEKPVVTTTAPVQGNDPGVTSVKVDESIDYSNNKNFNIELNKLIPSGVTAKKIIVNLSANGEMGTLSCGGGITLSGGNWQVLSNAKQNGTGSNISVEFDISEYANNLEMSNGVFQFSYWWGNQQTIKVDSVVCEYEGNNPVVTEAITTKAPVVTTTSKATTKVPTVTTSPAETKPSGDIDWSKVKYGDVDLSGQINIADLTLLSKHILNNALFPLGATSIENSDCSYDGKIDVNDTAILAEYIVDISVKLGK